MGTETRKVRLKVSTYGKAPARYGAHAYRVGIDDVPLLRQAGWAWAWAGSGRGYAYVIPPDGKAGKSVMIDVDVPVDGEIRRLGEALHAAGEPSGGHELGFIYRYRPANAPLYSVRMTGAVYADGSVDRPDAEPTVVSSVDAKFEFGVGCPWGVTLAWDGNSPEPTWRRRGE